MRFVDQICILRRWSWCERCDVKERTVNVLCDDNKLGRSRDGNPEYCNVMGMERNKFPFTFPFLNYRSNYHSLSVLRELTAIFEGPFFYKNIFFENLIYITYVSFLNYIKISCQKDKYYVYSNSLNQ